VRLTVIGHREVDSAVLSPRRGSNQWKTGRLARPVGRQQNSKNPWWTPEFHQPLAETRLSPCRHRISVLASIGEFRLPTHGSGWDGPQGKLTFSCDSIRSGLTPAYRYLMDGKGLGPPRNMPRVGRNRAGRHLVRSTVENDLRIGIKALTPTPFSEENWKKRPTTKSIMMRCCSRYLKAEITTLTKIISACNTSDASNELPDQCSSEMAKSS